MCGSEPEPGGTWTQDFRSVAAFYYGRRPTISNGCPTLHVLARLMEACWADGQADRPSSAFIKRLANEIATERWLKVADAPASDDELASYDDFLAKLGLQNKADALADCGLDEGLALKQLAEYDEDELEEDILGDEDLDLEDETKESFRVAVAELKVQAAVQDQAADESPGRRETVVMRAARSLPRRGWLMTRRWILQRCATSCSCHSNARLSWRHASLATFEGTPSK